MLRARAVAPREKFTRPSFVWVAQKLCWTCETVFWYDGGRLRPQSCLLFRDCTITKPKRLCNLELPPQVPESVKQFAAKVGHASPENKATICKKKFWYPSRYLQLDGLQICAEVLYSHSSIRRCGQSNPLGKLSRAAKHQQHDQIAHWIFGGAGFRLAVFKPLSAI